MHCSVPVSDFLSGSFRFKKIGPFRTLVSHKKTWSLYLMFDSRGLSMLGFAMVQEAQIGITTLSTIAFLLECNGGHT